MTSHEYLRQVLASQEMRDQDLRVIRSLRDELVAHLGRQLGSSPRIYYGGSYGKETMIRESFDLDLVVYYPHTESRTPLAQIFGAVHQALVNGKYVVHPQTVALRLPYEAGFHVDVVPGRAQDASFLYATLYKNSQPPSTLQTSLKVHIDAVRKTDLRQIVRLLKLWRLRHGVPLKTFALEILAARALTGHRRDDYGKALWTIFQFIAKEMRTVRLEDPANTNNILDITLQDRNSAAQKALESLSAQNWNQILW
jgi:hypothetical protein